MSKVEEWIKGITFTLFMAIAFYFLWTNFFSGILDFVGNWNISGITDTTSVSIIKTLTWINFIILYISAVPLFFIYNIIKTSQTETQPFEIIKAVAIWSFIFPIIIVIYTLIASLIGALDASAIISGDTATTANNFSWLIAGIVLIGLNFLPAMYLLKGYGMEVFSYDKKK